MATVLAMLLMTQGMLGAAPQVAGNAACAVTVDLVSGRRMTGEVDRRTDREHLWLRNSREGIVILRPIAWDRVVAAELGGESVNGGELLAAVRMVGEH